MGHPGPHPVSYRREGMAQLLWTESGQAQAGVLEMQTSEVFYLGHCLTEEGIKDH